MTSRTQIGSLASFSSVTIDGAKAAPDLVYYNGGVINNNTSSTQRTSDPVLKFTDQRQNPLVPDVANYELCVKNFSLNGVTKTLPLFIPQINPTTINLTVDGVEAIVIPGQANLNVTYTLAAPYTLFVGDPIDSVIGAGLASAYSFGPSIARNPGPFTITAVTSNSFTVQFGCLPTPLIPVSAVTFFRDPTDVTTTIYEVSVGIYNGSTYEIGTAPVIWVPENRANYTNVPRTALPTQLETDYYYCYTYTHMVKLINTALVVAWDAARTTLGPTIAGTQRPTIQFDETTGLFSLTQDSATSMVPWGNSFPQPYDSVVATVTASASGGTYVAGEYSWVGWNTCLDQLLSNFPSIYFGVGQTWAGSVQLLPEVVVNTGLTVDLITGGPTTNSPIGITLKTKPTLSTSQLINPLSGAGITDGYMCILTQDYKSTGGSWSPIASFVLVTSQIPVRNEANANPVKFGTANIGAGEANSGSFQKVLIETPINSVTADLWRGWVLYEPLTDTWSSLDPSHDGITDVDVTLFWRNRLTNSIVPVLVPNQGTMNLRLLFRRKAKK